MGKKPLTDEESEQIEVAAKLLGFLPKLKVETAAILALFAPDEVACVNDLLERVSAVPEPGPRRGRPRER